MKKKIFVVLLLALIGLVGFQNNWFGIFEKKTAYAVGDLNVLWGVPDGDPIFVVTNMLPGDMEQRTVNVLNGASSARDVGIIGVKKEEIASFSSILDFVISENSTEIWGGSSGTGPKTLADFFDEAASPSGLFLSTLPGGGSTFYTFKATFPSSAGNEYQNAKVVFDLIIGLSSELPDDCKGLDITNTVTGTSAAETLNGTPGSDLILGLEGADIINGNGGDDCIFGGEGAEDSIFGGEGNDVIFGNEGGDTIYGEGGDDLIFGGPGADNLYGGEGNDHLFGNEDTDLIEGGNGNDILEGGDGPDSLRGNAGDDNLIGGPGMDDANGGPDTDTCDAEFEIFCEL
ncbi:MAG: hypothetical protein A3C30_04495 [Candidatus Levybacteria bacterium RIFCSPHIGHO2_02_FULL_40_18]|nr:MAG: hypothetical protein A2869_01585 [Candidatus Levybacteria bacterium RIFCSPHIGHO2_01_FULL_40_58]OGH26339.1 MAG: hypothetical protein A3C30_04495 [Candidatus Levybacteria bacterium RIFCSPHIGHO2_02_FULL_40_18]OGH31299.1 MAG: hypothetical protein A3E43_02750 [Candidatus Levybacteria bacterium RIFCSPHIGHO2_12_FULL_40_31]OGH40801.1 MAG: hypothetical protein A2894_02185 [Candidatus Levybacteria bacterium RIFCSPLOWO2_01_FULL_40_64]